MPKPTLIYYSILKYQPDNLKLLHEYFNIIELPDPDHDKPNILGKADVIIAPLGYSCDKKKIESASNLKIIGSNTTGHPHIDIDYASEKHIKVITLKEYSEFLESITPTAELSWGLIIALTRKIIPAANSVLNGRWNRRPYGGKAMLSRMKLGIAGCGRLGTMVGRYAQSFRMKIRYYDPFVNVVENEWERVSSLEKLVALSDIITIHIPHEPETENLFNREIFSQFKRGSYLINTSRAELVDQGALLENLKSGTLAGAGLDVIENEFKPGFNIKNNPLWIYAKKHENLILTPHIGGSTIDAWKLTEEFMVKLVIKAMSKLRPLE